MRKLPLPKKLVNNLVKICLSLLLVFLISSTNAQIVPNGSFETTSPSSVLWALPTSTAATATVISTDASQGLKSLYMVELGTSNTSKTNFVVSPAYALTPGHTYTFTFDYKMNVVNTLQIGASNSGSFFVGFGVNPPVTTAVSGDAYSTAVWKTITYRFSFNQSNYDTAVNYIKINFNSLILGRTLAAVGLDNFIITDITQNFYSKSTGTLDLLSTWGTNPDGSGTAPLNFTDGAQIFNIVNQATPIIGSDWTVGGTLSEANLGSRIVVGDGVHATNFTWPVSPVLSISGTVNSVTAGTAPSGYGLIDVNDNSTLTIQALPASTNYNLPQTAIITTLGMLRPNSTVVYSGGAAQFINQPYSYNNAFGILTVNNPSGCTINSNTTNLSTNIATGLNLTAGLLTMGNNKSLTLMSSAKQTAYVKVGTGTIAYGLPAATTPGGRFIVERYIPANNRRSYVLVTSPVNPVCYAANAINPLLNISGQWQEGALGFGINNTNYFKNLFTNLYYGTQITGANTGNGFDAKSASGLASIFKYNDANTDGNKWVGITATDKTNIDSIYPGRGFLLFVRGDRFVNRLLTPFPSSNTVLRAAGTICIVDTTISSSLTSGTNMFSLIANPYASAISWTGLTRTNLTGYFYAYDPNLGVFVTSDGTTVSPATGSIVGQQQANVIQNGQAFFIQNDGSNSTPSIGFKQAATLQNTAGTATNQTVFGEQAVKARLNINMFKADSSFADGVVAVYDKDYKTALDKEDAAKMENFNETFSLLRNNSKLSIEGRPVINGKDTLFLNLSNFGLNEYTLQIDGSNFKDVTATLEDKYTNTKKVIDLDGNTSYKFTNTDVSSDTASRLMITFNSKAIVVAPDAVADNSLFVKMSPNPVIDQLVVNFKMATIENTVITVINSAGQVVKTVNAGKTAAGNITIGVSSLPAGLYIVQVVSGDKKVAVQKIIKQ